MNAPPLTSDRHSLLPPRSMLDYFVSHLHNDYLAQAALIWTGTVGEFASKLAKARLFGVVWKGNRVHFAHSRAEIWPTEEHRTYPDSAWWKKRVSFPTEYQFVLGMDKPAVKDDRLDHEVYTGSVFRSSANTDEMTIVWHFIAREAMS